MADSKAGQGRHLINREQVIRKCSKNSTIMGYVKGARELTGRVPTGQRWNDYSTKTNDIILDSNPDFKIITHESILAQIND